MSLVVTFVVKGKINACSSEASKRWNIGNERSSEISEENTSNYIDEREEKHDERETDHDFELVYHLQVIVSAGVKATSMKS